MGDDLDANRSAAPTLGLSGRYVIRRELGRGMMGVVFEAEDTLLGRTVALKTIELAFGVEEEAYQHFEERFFTEARVAAKLSHPGIVVCHDVGKDPASGKLFIVFEYLKGLTLADRIVADTIAWEDALAIVVRVARAIHHAHLNGVIHRDLKPANVMLLDSGHAGLESSDPNAIKIMDFGVARLESLPARLTRTGQSFGSPLYMSPEQVLGSAATARSDIFSLGSVLCTLLLGHGWFEARNIPEVLSRVVHDPAPAISKLRPHLPGTLDDVVARALAKRPQDRYPTAAALADDLEDVLAGLAPRHAGGLPGPAPPAAGGAGRDALLADLARDVGRAAAPVDPADALASLVDDAPSRTAAPGLLSSPQADRTLPVPARESPPRLGERRAGAESIPPQAAADLTLPSWDALAKPAPPQPAPERAQESLAGSPSPESRVEPADGRRSVVASARPRPLRAVAAVAAVAALLGTGALLLWGRAPEGLPKPSEEPGSLPPPETLPSATLPSATLPSATLPPATLPSAAPPSAAPPPVTEARNTEASAATLATSVPAESAGTPRPMAPARPRPVAPPTAAVETPASTAAASPAAASRGARMRLAVEHPFESGRLIVWIDGVLVYETKLQASASKTIVAIKVLEGRLEKLLDVEPGRHEVRVEVSWEDQHRVGTRLVDVAAGSTGLLEVKIARLTNNLSLDWSRLAD